MVQHIPTRLEQDTLWQWDLTSIFPTDQAWQEAFEDLSSKIKEGVIGKGKLDEGASVLYRVLTTRMQISERLETLYVYAHLKHDEDTQNTVYQEMYQKVLGLITQWQEVSAWFVPELMTLTDEQLEQYVAACPDLEVYAFYLKELRQEKDHILSETSETLLAGAKEVLTASSRTFSALNNADFPFPNVHLEDGTIVRLSHGLYGQLLESQDRDVRQEAYTKLYDTYQSLANTFASTLSATVQLHNYEAQIRNYPSARAAALSANDIPESVYDALETAVTEHLPLLHRYVSLRKDVLGVTELYPYDLYVPLVPEGTAPYTYQEGQALAKAALQVLGEEYQGLLDRAFSERWIDVYENIGKRSGAYSSGGYNTLPYVLMNWHDSLDQVYTLVHELGHSMHSYYTRTNQPYVYGDYSIFLAEIASTTNEHLLTAYLLDQETDPMKRMALLVRYLDGVKGTVFRQTQFATFERMMHEAQASGTPLTQDWLSETYRTLNTKYYGNALQTDDHIAYEWARIPHFYYRFYVYQYATGFAAATHLSEAILSEGTPALERYLTYLKAGSSDTPIRVMQQAGVDMTQTAYLDRTFDVFDTRLKELEQLISEYKK